MNCVKMRRAVQSGLTALMACATAGALMVPLAFPLVAPLAATPHQIAVTFDDLPYVSGPAEVGTTKRQSARMAEQAIVAALTENHVPATGFVNDDKVEALGADGVSLIAQWNRGDLSLGNHGYSHFDSNALSVAEIERDILRGEQHIRPLAEAVGRRVAFFRFPYNHIGETPERRRAIDAMLARHGYTLAASTIDSEDYLFNTAYECAFAIQDVAAQNTIKQAYLDYTYTEIPYYQALNQQVMGHDVPAILLLHANRLNASALPDILAFLKTRGYRFLSLGQAQADKAFSTPVGPSRYGPMWGYRWARTLGVPVNGTLEQEPPAWVGAYCKTHQTP